jgi:pimeloyl-ACP methyl ester carboxylesterase
MTPLVRLFVLLCSILLVTSCSKEPTLSPRGGGGQASLASSAPAISATALVARFRGGALARTRAAAPRLAPAAASREIRGTVGGGSEYAIFVPDDWNGDLVLYTHGYIPAAAPVGIASVEALGEHLTELRAFLLARGFAVAYSSYSENGFNVKEGAIATNQLRELFSAKVQPAGRTYVIGQSLGALDAIELVEREPESYAGVLTVAGVLGGSQAAIDYYGHIRVLFDKFYPGVLPGSLLELPDHVDLFHDIIVPASTAMAANPEGAFVISQLDQTPVPFRDGTELGTSIIAALVFHAIALDDLFDRTHGHSFFGNDKTVYTSATLPPEVVAFVNVSVSRYSLAPDAAAYLARNYETTGGLFVPAITLHMRWDPIAPLFHETIYRDKVAQNGRPDLLEQRTIDAYGHPGAPPIGAEISASEIAEAFADLVARAEPASRLPSASATVSAGGKAGW